MVDPTKLILALVFLIIMPFARVAALDSSDTGIINSAEILSKIEAGEDVNYDNVVVEGDLIFGQAIKQPGKAVTSSIDITNSEIQGKVDGINITFGKSVNFERSKFLGPANFERACFNDRLIFDYADLDNSSFRKVQFNNSADFFETQFIGPTDFSRTVYRGDEANFKRTQFKDYVTFWASSFDTKSSDFEQSKFYKFAIFLSTEFGGDANFGSAQFKDVTDFRFANFSRYTNFLGARFDKEIDLTGIKFTNLQLTWESLNGKLICNGPVYLALIKNFKELDQMEDADNCYFEYREWRRKNSSLGWPKVLDYFAWLSCGYGVRWQHTLLLGVLVMVIFGVYYEIGYLTRAVIDIFNKGSAKKPSLIDLWKSMKKSISLSAMILLSLPSDWFPYGKDAYSNYVRSHLPIAILERLIGWGLMLLLIGTLTRLMVRY